MNETQKKGTHTNHKIIKMHFSFLFQHLIAANILFFKKNLNDCYGEQYTSFFLHLDTVHNTL